MNTNDKNAYLSTTDLNQLSKQKVQRQYHGYRVQIDGCQTESDVEKWVKR